MFLLCIQFSKFGLRIFLKGIVSAVKFPFLRCEEFKQICNSCDIDNAVHTSDIIPECLGGGQRQETVNDALMIHHDVTDQISRGQAVLINPSMSRIMMRN